MPLQHSASQSAFESNLQEEMKTHPQKQALAIAYSIRRRAGGEPEVAKGEYKMTGKEAMAEHLQLLQTLASPSHADDKAELARQAEEMPEIAAAVAKSEHDLGDPPHDAPTDGQKAAQNYRHAHWTLHGMHICIENLAGSTRSGVDPDGKPWEAVMPYHYGYIRNHGTNHETTGADGDKIDVAVGPMMGGGDEAHIINQLNPKTGAFDEHKIFIGFPTREAAISAFRQGRSDNPDEVLGGVITVPIEELKRWIAEGCLEEEAILKSEHTAHVKAHYRVVDGKVLYIPGYDKTVHGEHPEASLHQRTVYGVHKEGTHFLRATDAEDRESIKAAAAKAGVEIHHIKRAGATHHGRVGGAYDVVHFNSEADAKQVHDMLATQEELEAKLNPKGDDTSGFYSVKLGAAVKPEPSHADPGLKADTTQQDLDQLDGLDDAVINYSHGISQAKKIHGYLPGGGASSYKAITDMLQKKAALLSKHGKHADAAATHVLIHEWEEKAKASQKQADYIEADLPVIVTQAQTTHNLGLFKLAAMIAMTKAQAEESKASPDPEKAKLWWTNAASFATLAQQK